MANRVAPVVLDEQQASSSSPLLEIMRAYIQSRCCYHSSALSTARVVHVQGLVAYQIDFWTLMERRWWKQREKPYNGEYTPALACGSPWNYDFPAPNTVLTGKYKEQHSIEQTRWKCSCSKCRGVGITTCSRCNGRRTTDCLSCNHTGISDGRHCSRCGGTGVKRCGKCGALGKVNCTRCETRGELLFWFELQIQRYTVHSVEYQTNSPLKKRTIRKAPTKTIYWTIDQQWSQSTPFEGHFQAAFANQPPVAYLVQLDKLNQQYARKHLKKTKKYGIVRLQWRIQKLDITEVEYELQEFQNKKQPDMENNFRFYYYGQDKKNKPLIYENDYPQNACGCFGVGCAHHSKCCVVS